MKQSPLESYERLTSGGRQLESAQIIWTRATSVAVLVTTTLEPETREWRCPDSKLLEPNEAPPCDGLRSHMLVLCLVRSKASTDIYEDFTEHLRLPFEAQLWTQ